MRRQPKWGISRPPAAAAAPVREPVAPAPPTPFDPVLSAWDDLHSAIQRISTAQPYQMTEAAERLDKARMAMQREIMQYAGLIYAAEKELPTSPPSASP